MCSDCDFATVQSDGTLICAIRDEQTHGDAMCEDWQAQTRLIDGDGWYEVVTWPARRRKSPRS